MIKLIKNNLDFLFCEFLFISILFVSFMETLEINLRIILLVISISLGIIKVYKLIKKKNE